NRRKNEILSGVLKTSKNIMVLDIIKCHTIASKLQKYQYSKNNIKKNVNYMWFLTLGITIRFPPSFIHSFIHFNEKDLVQNVKTRTTIDKQLKTAKNEAPYFLFDFMNLGLEKLQNLIFSYKKERWGPLIFFIQPHLFHHIYT
ncbi:hypothetical protein ACJX0J_018548, partial [Zea mays]